MGINFRYGMSDTASEWSMRRRRRVAGKLANVCPHIGFVEPTKHGDGTLALQVQFLFETFFGTTLYLCLGCGTKWSRFAIDIYERQLKAQIEGDMVATYKEIRRRMSQADGLVKKLNRMGSHPGR